MRILLLFGVLMVFVILACGCSTTYVNSGDGHAGNYKDLDQDTEFETDLDNSKEFELGIEASKKIKVSK